MKEKTSLFSYFTPTEIALWSSSVLLILVSFFVFDRAEYLTPAASLVGVTSLIFNAKGNPIGQVLMILFSLLYGFISWQCSYYGEMITYLGMTMPMAAVALISWLCHPFRGRRSVVEVGRLSRGEPLFLLLLTAAVTVGFYFILAAFETPLLFLATVSVATSFFAAYLTFRRSPYFALAYAANDIVLILLWIVAAQDARSYLSVVICFFAFLLNDLYGFLSWRKLRQEQGETDKDSAF